MRHYKRKWPSPVEYESIYILVSVCYKKMDTPASRGRFSYMTGSSSPTRHRVLLFASAQSILPLSRWRPALCFYFEDRAALLPVPPYLPPCVLPEPPAGPQRCAVRPEPLLQTTDRLRHWGGTHSVTLTNTLGLCVGSSDRNFFLQIIFIISFKKNLVLFCGRNVWKCAEVKLRSIRLFAGC